MNEHSETAATLILIAGLLACFTLAALVVLSRDRGRQVARRHPAHGRRPYRFVTPDRDAGNLPTGAPSAPPLPAPPARPGASQHPSRRVPARSGDLTAAVVKEAVTGAREVLKPATVVAKAAVRAAVAAATEAPRAPKSLSGVKNTWRPDPRVSLAPNGFWIDTAAAPPGFRVYFRWFDGRHAHDGAVIFNPQPDTGGHFVPTLSRPVAATLLSAERPA